ncbi:MAG: hypothetical protein V3U36_03590 [Anaerolineales bacterium]|jgi:hypothetical protein
MQREVLLHKSIDIEILEIAEKNAFDPEAVVGVLLELHTWQGVLEN